MDKILLEGKEGVLDVFYGVLYNISNKTFNLMGILYKAVTLS